MGSLKNGDRSVDFFFIEQICKSLPIY
jgi:hypothetical protein